MGSHVVANGINSCNSFTFSVRSTGGLKPHIFKVNREDLKLGSYSTLVGRLQHVDERTVLQNPSKKIEFIPRVREGYIRGFKVKVQGHGADFDKVPKESFELDTIKNLEGKIVEVDRMNGDMRKFEEVPVYAA